MKKYNVLVTFLIAETKYMTLKIKENKGLFSSQFMEVSVHNQLAPRQGGTGRGTTVHGGGRQQE